MKTVWLLILSLACTPALSAGAGGGNIDKMPPFLHFPLRKGSFFDDIYKNSIAEDIYLVIKNGGKAPPIQHLRKPASGELLAQAELVSKEILNNLGVNAGAKNTLRLNQVPFRAGPKRSLSGYLIEYQSRENNETTITCMAFIRRENNLHAIWLQAYQVSLPDCSKHLVALSRDPSMY